MKINTSYHYALRVTADKRLYDDLRKGPVTLRYPKGCKKCKRYEEKLKKIASKSKVFKDMNHKEGRLNKSRRIVDLRVRLNSTADWQTSPLAPTHTTSNESLANSNVFGGNLCNRLDNQENKDSFQFLQNSSSTLMEEVPCNSLSKNKQGDNGFTSTEFTTARCRFCHGKISSQQKANEKLISSCLCTGSLKYAHKTCLETLLNKNECDVCRAKYEAKWMYHNNKRFLHFVPMEKRDVLVLIITIALYISLIILTLGTVYIVMMADVMSTVPIMVRVTTVFSFSISLLWLLIGCVIMTTILYTSRYWTNRRNGGNRKKLLILSSNNNYKDLDGENVAKPRDTGMASGMASPDENVQETIKLINEIDFSKPVPV